METSYQFRSFSVLYFVLCLILAGCGGGGGGGGGGGTPPPPPPTSGSISGTVAGTEIIAVNDSGNIIASDDTVAKTPDAFGNYPFTLNGISTGINIRVYLITGSGVYPLYFDSNSPPDGIPDTNVFSLSAVATIDLGFVDTSGPTRQAIPENNPVDVPGISAQVENTANPAKASLIGTWGFSRLKHKNGGTWASMSGKFIYKADGTGSTLWQENDNDVPASATETWTWAAAKNADGSITLTRTYPDSSIKTRRVVIADDDMAMILDGTDNFNQQRFRVAVRMDPAKTHTNADFSGNFYDVEYFQSGTHAALSADGTSDGAGSYSRSASGNYDGTIFSGVDSGTYSVAVDGSVAITPGVGSPGVGYVGSNGRLGVLSKSGSLGVWHAGMTMTKADRSYTTTDLAGTWAFASFQDDNNGTNYTAAFGTVSCDGSGNCTINEKRQRDGIVTIQSTGPYVFTVQADGSFGVSFGASTPAYAGAIGNDGNVLIFNPSFEDTTFRKNIIGVRCGTCSELASGGGPRLTQLTDNPANDWHPYWSADGARIVFTSDRSVNDDIWVMNADGGSPVQITTNTAQDSRPYWSPDGTQIVFESDRTGNWEIWKMDADGTGLVQLTNNAAIDSHPAWSPDGTRIAFQSNRDGNHDIWLMNTDGTGLTKLTTNAAGDTHPMWKPDGTQIAFARNLGSNDIWVMNADGSNQHALTTDPADEQHPDWSPDGTRIAFRSDKVGNYDVWIMDADGSNQQQLTTHPAEDRNPDWSPDGTQIMFRSDRTGNQEIWTYTLP